MAHKTFQVYQTYKVLIVPFDQTSPLQPQVYYLTFFRKVYTCIVLYVGFGFSFKMLYKIIYPTERTAFIIKLPRKF